MEEVFETQKYMQNLDRFVMGLKEKYLSVEEAYKKLLTKFFTPLEFEYRVRKELNRYLALEFNVFSLFPICENTISDIIAFLLNPEGAHGQGYLFLKEFLEVLKEKNEVLKEKLEAFEILDVFSEVYVVREKSTYTGRRIDIFIKLPGFTIGIENKPWAGEQDRQLIDYSKFLEEVKEKESLLIYLDGYGREAKSIGEAKEILKKEGKFLEVSYNNFLKHWLKKCYTVCEAEKVRMFLKDFINWIEANFKEEVSEDERK